MVFILNTLSGHGYLHFLVFLAHRCFPYQGCTQNVYSSKGKYLETNLTAYTTSKIKPASPLGPMFIPAMDFWPCLQYQAWILSCRAGFKFNQQLHCYPHNSHGRSTSCLAGWYCSTKLHHPVGMLKGILLPFSGCTALEARKQRGRFQSRTGLCFSIPCNQCVLSFLIGLFHLDTVSNQEQC